VSHSNDFLNFETDLNFRETAFLYIHEARSWLPHFHKSPDCYRITDDAVLRKYIDCLSWIRMADSIDLHNFWDQLLEEHRFESDSMKAQRVWEEICAASAAPRYNPQVAGPLPKPEPARRDINYWDPEEWDGTPHLVDRTPEEQAAYEKQHPILYPPKAEGGEVGVDAPTTMRARVSLFTIPGRTCDAQ
jgi:hypothetical protein